VSRGTVVAAWRFAIAVNRFWSEEEPVAVEDRGFASMDRDKQRGIASLGGKAAHQKGTAHEWTCEEAREAGRKGGMASHRRRRQDRPVEPEAAVVATAADEGHAPAPSDAVD
jgi:general stress protein YciG